MKRENYIDNATPTGSTPPGDDSSIGPHLVDEPNGESKKPEATKPIEEKKPKVCITGGPTGDLGVA